MKKEKKGTTLPMEDPRRLAYMIAWRDRYIKALEEKVAGWEEESALLKALLFYALMEGSSGGAESREATVSKSALSALLGAWECRAEDAGEAYLVHFALKTSDKEEDKPAGEGDSDGAEGAEG